MIVREIGVIYTYRDPLDDRNLLNGMEIRVVKDCGHYYESVKLSTQESFPFLKDSILNKECLTKREY